MVLKMWTKFDGSMLRPQLFCRGKNKKEGKEEIKFSCCSLLPVNGKLISKGKAHHACRD
jgi:hypothetical protein